MLSHVVHSVALRSFGGLAVVDASHMVAAGVQAKRLLLLVRLLVARPRPWQRREVLLSLFWPESGPGDASTSLRQSLHHLRRVFGQEAVLTRGTQEVGIAPAAVTCDALELEAAAAAGEHERVLALAQGDFLEGVYAPRVAPELEWWVDQERARYRGLVATSAWALAEASEARGDAEAAIRHARHAVALLGDDEVAFRRMLQLCDRVGNGALALREYEVFERRLGRVLGMAPSAPTRALADSLRTRSWLEAVPA